MIPDSPATPDSPDEIPLPGGNVGGAVRVGDTVRRPTGPWTPAVHELLEFLADAGLPRSRACWASTTGAGRSSPSCRAGCSTSAVRH